KTTQRPIRSNIGNGLDRRGLDGNGLGVGRGPMFPPAKVARAACAWRYLHSCSILSSAWARPLSEYWSLDWVPRPEVPFTVNSAPLAMASTIRVASAAFLIQAPSSLVYIAKLAAPISAVAYELVLNG